jgi:5-methylcytosine-specific restriction endonuclease McrA
MRYMGASPAERQRIYRLRHPERVKEQKERYRNANRDRINAERRKKYIPKERKPITEETRERLRQSHLGKKQSKETIEKRRLKLCGVYHWNWKGGITKENSRIRQSYEYVQWRRAVLKRDNYTCRICKKTGGKIEADHILPFSTHPEKRLDIDNGRTLCKPCHLSFGKMWGGAQGRKKLVKNGKLGGAKTKQMYGIEHFKNMANKRWSKRTSV